MRVSLRINTIAARCSHRLHKSTHVFIGSSHPAAAGHKAFTDLHRAMSIGSTPRTGRPQWEVEGRRSEVAGQGSEVEGRRRQLRRSQVRSERTDAGLGSGCNLAPRSHSRQPATNRHPRFPDRVGQLPNPVSRLSPPAARRVSWTERRRSETPGARRFAAPELVPQRAEMRRPIGTNHPMSLPLSFSNRPTRSGTS